MHRSLSTILNYKLNTITYSSSRFKVYKSLKVYKNNYIRLLKENKYRNLSSSLSSSSNLMSEKIKEAKDSNVSSPREGENEEVTEPNRKKEQIISPRLKYKIDESPDKSGIINNLKSNKNNLKSESSDKDKLKKKSSITISQEDKDAFQQQTVLVEDKRKKDNYKTLNEIKTWPEYYEKYSNRLINALIANKKGLSSLKGLKKYEVNEKINGKVSLWRGDITKLECDSVVNAANSSLLGGGGIDGAIHRAAGPDLLKECKGLKGCKSGEAKTTNGYRLPAKHVIHTVGPQDQNEVKLRSCYKTCLREMQSHNLASIAFCCISTGIYGYNNEKAAHVALETIRNYLEDLDSKKLDSFNRVVFCLFLDKDIDIYEGLMQYYFPIDVISSSLTRENKKPSSKKNSSNNNSSTHTTAADSGTQKPATGAYSETENSATAYSGMQNPTTAISDTQNTAMVYSGTQNSATAAYSGTQNTAMAYSGTQIPATAISGTQNTAMAYSGTQNTATAAYSGTENSAIPYSGTENPTTAKVNLLSTDNNSSFDSSTTTGSTPDKNNGSVILSSDSSNLDTSSTGNDGKSSHSEEATAEEDRKFFFNNSVVHCKNNNNNNEGGGAEDSDNKSLANNDKNISNRYNNISNNYSNISNNNYSNISNNYSNIISNYSNIGNNSSNSKHNVISESFISDEEIITMVETARA